jgi:parallel beta-helix repeat protein
MATLIPKFDLMNGTTSPVGAVNRPINQKLSDMVSVKDFGAVGDGVTNDTVAINNALSIGQSIFFPKGTYLVSTLTVSPSSSSFSIVGEGAYDSIIKTNTTTGDVLTISTAFNSVQNIGFRSVNPRTANAFIKLTGNNILIDNCNFQYGYIGIESSGVLNRIQNCTVDFITPFTTSENSCGILCTANILSVFGTAVSSTSLNVADFGRSGFMVTGGELDIDQSFAFLTAYGLYAFAGPNKPPILGININKCWFDSHSQNGIRIQAQGDGTSLGRGIISLIWVKNSWISSGYDNTANPIGLAISTTANIFDSIGNIFIEGNVFYNYNNTVPATGSATIIDIPNNSCYANISNNQIGVPSSSVWGNGLFIDNATNFTVNNNLITSNTRGIYLGSSTNDYLITDNIITGATTAIDNTSTFTGVVLNNFGYNPVGASAVSVGASPYTFTVGPSPTTLYIYGGTVSAIVQDGQTIAQQTNTTVNLGPNESVTITYSSLPTIKKMVH